MRRLTVIVVLAGLLVAYGSVALATPSSGVTSLPIAKGRFGEIDVKAKTDIDTTTRTYFWQAAIDTKGTSDLEIVASLIPAGAARRIDQPNPGNCSF